MESQENVNKLDVVMSKKFLTSGTKKFGLNVESNFSFSGTDLALLAFNRKLLILRLSLIGTSDMNSTPPATITS